MTIENLKKVYWGFESFIINLTTTKGDQQNEILDLCAELKENEDFGNICHRAVQEVEYLYLNNKVNIIESYFEKFIYYQTKLKQWKVNHLQDKSLMNQIKIALSPISAVQNEIEKHVQPKIDEVTYSPIFNVSKIKANWKYQNSRYEQRKLVENPYQLGNPNTYSRLTGELLHKAEQNFYNDGFIGKAKRLTQMEFRPFFEYHYSGSQDKRAFLAWLKYGFIEIAGLHNGLKNFVLDWMKEKQFEPHPSKNEYPYSVLEWATIFYYADETKLLPESRTLKTRIEQFIKNYEINTTFKYFRTQYYAAKKRINEKNDYPINKLELIIPFLEENYKQTVTKVENDIIFLEDNKPEY